ncbi:hypothetical protein T492DRAFT_1116054 [Pavlovales sp. CCMP2436]|nr:hypothetical protein T492DRAFT_1116054 [Pavlovales sp. CCMP2436]
MFCGRRQDRAELRLVSCGQLDISAAIVYREDVNVLDARIARTSDSLDEIAEHQGEAGDRGRENLGRTCAAKSRAKMGNGAGVRPARRSRGRRWGMARASTKNASRKAGAFSSWRTSSLFDPSPPAITAKYVEPTIAPRYPRGWSGCGTGVRRAVSTYAKLLMIGVARVFTRVSFAFPAGPAGHATVPASHSQENFGHLFAFSEMILDCRTKEYPKEIDEEVEKMIKKYYKSIYRDPDVCKYMWDSDTLLLNGCNLKSNKFAVIKNVLGDYMIKLNPETFTKAPKGANATSELYLAKGRRMVFFNKPENDADNKLQVGLLKKLADGHKAVLKTRSACNNKPPLSSVDGGAGRRVRVVEWVTKFVEVPDPLQAKLDNEMVSKLFRSPNLRRIILESTKESGSKMVAGKYFLGGIGGIVSFLT